MGNQQEFKPESLTSILLSKIVNVIALAVLSIVISGIISILFLILQVAYGFNEILSILGIIEILIGALFTTGFTENSFASQTFQNPLYTETVITDRIKYRSVQIFQGLNLIFTGFIISILAYIYF